ncbi:glycoside hydrolase family protein [Saccharicrinis fermentans]|uniref:Uncharacterized protein n=1 Tax=Saccharicrinis fermentans DSM 9555 = JCM 21142 TaxID=869213 RepID=W7YRF2_9BACT|nr:hypothetical protein [Saccharicrinis fermentans]GAF05039.1 hypothetical protein JCM21142_93762 [Saccharicrinis fermentans DSM 9555 = JCM 21142]
MKSYLLILLSLTLFTSCIRQKEAKIPDTPFPYTVTQETGDREMSVAMKRSFKNYSAIHPRNNELYSQFKYTPLKGLDYHNHDGTITRRDPSKIIFENGQYYVWYTKRDTPVIPVGAKNAEKANDTIPSTDWDLSEIWYATSKDGFTWKEQGVAVPRPPKPIVAGALLPPPTY